MKKENIKKIRKIIVYKFALMLMFFIMPALPVQAEPIISSAPSSATDEQSITISGSAFGTGATVYKWDDFEGATHVIGNPVGVGPTTGNQIAWTTTQTPAVVESNGRGNTGKCWYNETLRGLVLAYPWEESDTRSAYVSYYLKWDGVINGSNDKWVMPVGPTTEDDYYYYAPGVFGAWQSDGSDVTAVYFGREETVSHTATFPAVAPFTIDQRSWTPCRPAVDQWVRHEFFGIESTPSAANGTAILSTQRTTDGAFVSVLNYDGNAVTRDDASEHWKYAVFGLLGASIRFDEIYIASSRARIEIGNNADWDLCTHREIQIPTAWDGVSATNTITATVNQGSFQNGDTAYLFVIDENGEPSAGREITIGGEPDATSPGAPSGLSVS